MQQHSYCCCSSPHKWQSSTTYLRAVDGITERRDARHDLLHRLVERQDDVVAAFKQQSTLQTPSRLFVQAFSQWRWTSSLHQANMSAVG